MRRILAILAIFGLFWCILAGYEPIDEENPEADGEESAETIIIKIGESLLAIKVKLN